MEARQKEAIISIIETNKIIESIRNEIENLCKTIKYKEDQMEILKLKILTLKYKNSVDEFTVLWKRKRGEKSMNCVQITQKLPSLNSREKNKPEIEERTETKAKAKGPVVFNQKSNSCTIRVP